MTTPIRPRVAVIRWVWKLGTTNLPNSNTKDNRSASCGCAIFFLCKSPTPVFHPTTDFAMSKGTAPPKNTCPLAGFLFLTQQPTQQPKRFLLVVGCMFVPMRQLAGFSRGRGWNCRLWYDDRRRLDGHTSVRLHMDPKNTTGLSSKRSVQTAGFSQSEKRYLSG